MPIVILHNYKEIKIVKLNKYKELTVNLPYQVLSCALLTKQCMHSSQLTLILTKRMVRNPYCPWTNVNGKNNVKFVHIPLSSEVSKVVHHTFCPCRACHVCMHYSS